MQLYGLSRVAVLVVIAAAAAAAAAAAVVVVVVVVVNDLSNAPSFTYSRSVRIA